MICISSFRPKSKASPQIWENQTNAWNSWIKVFDEIVWFNAPEPDFEGAFFIPTEGKPTIESMAKHASKCNDYVAIVNADIILDSRLNGIFDRMVKNTPCHCATSLRYNFNPGEAPETGTITDNGLDIFIAHPAVWRKVAQFIPVDFKLGMNAWDTCVLGMFTHYSRNMVGDFSQTRTVFHPFHEERGDQFVPESARRSEFMSLVRWPAIQIA